MFISFIVFSILLPLHENNSTLHQLQLDAEWSIPNNSSHQYWEDSQYATYTRINALFLSKLKFSDQNHHLISSLNWLFRSSPFAAVKSAQHPRHYQLNKSPKPTVLPGQWVFFCLSSKGDPLCKPSNRYPTLNNSLKTTPPPLPLGKQGGSSGMMIYSACLW